MPHTTRERRATLRELLGSGDSHTQAELCERLEGLGFPVTQSTVSRDLKRLGARRSVGDDGTSVYRLSARKGLAPGMVTEVGHNEQMVVVRTEVGRAQAVGFDLDALGHPEVLGTLAGDDTVLVVPRSVDNTSALAQEIRRLAGLG